PPDTNPPDPAASASAGKATDTQTGTLPYAGSASGGTQAVLLSPTPAPDAAVVGTASDSNDTMSLVWMMVVAIMAIPGLIIMTLIATVLIRR
ncbi:MAG TPA: hypothetical protein VIT43_02035, partial [Candidatus Dormibacteraeota bacterium]